MKGRVLVVDDEAGVRESFSHMLQGALDAGQKAQILVQEGQALLGEEQSAAAEPGPEAQTYELTLCADGEQAVTAVATALEEERPYAVAFIDMKMPGMDGSETAATLWQQDPRIKIVIVTAYSEYAPEDVIRQTGRQDLFYLRKPFAGETVRQFARALYSHWQLERRNEQLVKDLEQSNTLLEQFNASLQQKVEEKVNMLIQSEKMAAVGMLAGGIAHEIKNPLTYIDGNLSSLSRYSQRLEEVLQRYADFEKSWKQKDKRALGKDLEAIVQLKRRQKIPFVLEDLKAAVDESQEGCRRIQSIVRELSIFTRDDEDTPQPQDLNETVDQSLRIMQHTIGSGIDVVRDYGELPMVTCAPKKILQVLMNLIHNAVEAMAGQGTLTLQTRYVDESQNEQPRGHVEIRVQDSGCGVPLADIGRIFEPFYSNNSGKHSGLGLGISYEIMQQHAGSLKVTSEEGVGSTFTMVLPLTQRDWELV